MRIDKKAVYDQLLVLRCQAGRQEAWEELVARWEKPLLYYIRRMVDDEHRAWQILQETWLCVVKDISMLKCPEYLPKWLYSICRKQIITYYRKSNHQLKLQEEVCNEVPPGDVEPDCRFENAEAVHWGLGQLTPVFREVLTLFFLQDLTIDEMAQVLDVPPGTVKSRLYYARKHLRKILEDQQ